MTFTFRMPDEPTENFSCDNAPDCPNRFDTQVGDKFLCFTCADIAFEDARLEREAKHQTVIEAARDAVADAQRHYAMYGAALTLGACEEAAA